MTTVKEDLDRYFDYGIYPTKRMLYLGSFSDGEGREAGVDYQMFEGFLKGLTYLDAMSDRPITIHMNTDGGDWYHGMAIYHAIQACRSHVTIIAWGYACSMGSLIFQAADVRLIARDCVFMIHDGSEGMDGGARSFEAWGREVLRTRKAMYRVYFDRMVVVDPSMPMTKIERLCSHDRIYTPEQTIALGLADDIMDKFRQIEDE